MIPTDQPLKNLFAYYSEMYRRKLRAVPVLHTITYGRLIEWNKTRKFDDEPTFDSMHGTRHVWTVMNRKYRKYKNRRYS